MNTEPSLLVEALGPTPQLNYRKCFAGLFIILPFSQSINLKHFYLHGHPNTNGSPCSCSNTKIYINALLQTFIALIA